MPQNPAPRASLHRLVIAAVVLAIGGVLAAASPASAAVCSPAGDHLPAAAPAGNPGQPILLADEIIRRLRRIGINVNKTRLSHPYDPDDWIC